MATIVKRSVKGAPLTHDEVDANFDNLNTELATKIGGSGGTVNDNKIINFGDGNDLQIYHNASASDAYILNNTGELYIRGDNITLGSVDPTSPTFITMDEDGAVELYFNNTKKLETTTDGINVFGKVNATDTLAIQGDLVAEGNLEAAGISVTEGVTAPGTSAFGNIQASGYISASGNVITQGELATEGGLTSDGDVQINANAVATGSVTAASFIGGAISGTSLNITGLSSLGNDVTVTGNVDVSGNVTGTFTGSVDASSINSKGDISSVGNVTVGGSVTSGSITANGLISGRAISSTGAITSNGGINSVGDVTVSGALSVTDAEQTRANLDVDQAGIALALSIALS